VQEVVETEVEEVADQVVDSDHDVDSGHQTVGVWQGEDAGVGCDEDHGHVEAAAVVGAVVVEENTVAEGPSFVSHADTQAAGLRLAVGVEEHTVADSQRRVDTDCTAVEVGVAGVGPQAVVVDIVVEDVSAASACPDHHNHNLHTKHFAQGAVLEAAEEQTMLECKPESPVVVVVAAAGLPLPNRRNNLEVQQVVVLEEVVVAAGCMSVAV
jgi:hypothetical protein